MKRIFLLFLLLVTAISVQARPGLLDSLGLDSDDQAVPPTVDEAFSFSASVIDANTILARWIVAEGNYLYRDKINFTLLDSGTTRLLDFVLPAGEDKMDEKGGT